MVNITVLFKILPEIRISREFEWVSAQNDSDFQGTTVYIFLP